MRRGGVLPRRTAAADKKKGEPVSKHKEHDAAERLKAEAAAVSTLRDHLQSMGHAPEADDLLDISIESETDFKEVLTTFLDAEANACALADAIGDRIEALRERKTRIEKRSEYLRSLIQVGVEMAGSDKVETPVATVSLTRSPPKAIITEESEIPSAYWKPQPPKVDQAALTKAIRERVKALDAAAKIADIDARKAAQEEAAKSFPEIPGVTASNPVTSITIRRR